MRNVNSAKKFRRDLKKCKSRGYNLPKIHTIIDNLRHDRELPAVCRPHKLIGNYVDCWECHIAPDWLLIYELPDDTTLVLRRTGTHSDLF